MELYNFGSLNIDYVYAVPHFVRPGETLGSKSLQINCGGKGLNQSIAATRAGLSVKHLGAVGEDGAFLLEKLSLNGVDTTKILKVPEKTGHAIIQIDASGQNCIILYQGANYCLTDAYVDSVLAEACEGDWVLLQNETNCISSIIYKAAERGLRIAMNAAPCTQDLLSLPLEKLSLLFVNETEGAFLSGESREEDILSTLLSRYPGITVVLTLGEKGAFASNASETAFQPAFHVAAVDTTAAGDTFTGYFISAYTSGLALSASLKVASAASALAVQKKGAADSVPERGQVTDWLTSVNG